ncbi:MAG TPA: hypothetical protein PLW61_07150, partial [Caldisericia bacterium]|nr:hypothetical protein [Caldisericia bacterium]
MSRLFPKKYKTFIILAIFGIAMGFLEAIVVVYLREIYYPQGFEFPLNTFSPEMLSIEWIREISTIIMLITIGIIAGKNFLQKLSFFLYTFAIWDIFYYVALKLFLNWPPSLLTWDILFLIPVPWIGPVLAPIICSLTMILLGGSIVFLQEKGYIVKMKTSDWVLLFLGAFIIFCTFIWNYFRIIVQEELLSSFWTLANNEHLQEIISQYKPTYY